MNTGDNNTKARTVKVKDLRRVELVFFLIGFIAAFLALLIYMEVFKGGVFLPRHTYEYYKGMEDTYGKYYNMQTAIEKDSYFSYEIDDMDDELASSVIAGLKDDEYAKYYSAEEYEQFKHRYSSYVGIGISLKESDGKIVITAVSSDGPAAEAGVKTGDVIVSIDGKKPESLQGASDMISGEAGTSVKMVIERDGKKQTVETNRTEVKADSVVYKVYDKDAGIGYVRLINFAKGTSKEFKTAVKDLKNQGCRKLIIDLRDNTGGREDEGLDVADDLLPSCIIISEKNSSGEEKTHKSGQSSIGMDYVLLVNEYTASSSEIVASAVKANKGGLIIGTKTYGKGLIQKLHEFDDGSAYKYTTGEYLAADGSKVNKVGVTPDIEATGDAALKAAVDALK